MMLLIDDETHSYWDHVTGECVHGEHAGSRMPNWGIEITTVEAALQREPELRVLVSKPPLIGRLIERLFAWRDLVLWGRLPPGFRRTMAESDSRLPEMEMGLGVVTETMQRFYRMSDIRDGISDTLGDRRLCITIGADDGVPNAVWEDDSRPLQLFTRWYGFSFTYPGCNVYETA